jgi:hypothetical protein
MQINAVAKGPLATNLLDYSPRQLSLIPNISGRG